jgi:hypothetical protein
MGATTLSITTFNIMTFSLNSKLYFAVVVMLIVHIIQMLCCVVIVLNVIMLVVIVLNVIMLSVMAPLNEAFSNSSKVTMIVVFSNKN